MAIQTQQRKPYFLPEQYLAAERLADFKSEYLNGQIYAKAGGTPQHGAIALNTGSELRAQLKGRPCQVFPSDVKVRTTLSGLFAYPDVFVVCGELEFHDAHGDVLTNPVLIVEVLSDSTEAYDRGRKFFQYRQIETLTDYLLIAQNEPTIDHYVRLVDRRWLLNTVVGLEARLYIASLDCTLLLSEIYDKIAFDAEESASETGDG